MLKERVQTLDERLSAVLRERGQRVTPQRLVIARAVAGSDRHVTAEAVFEEVRDRLPGISLPTVYATLELLEELRIVRRVATHGGTIVYDSRREPHDHLVCRVCGQITDAEAVLDRRRLLDAVRDEGFSPEEAQLIVSGTCADCRAAAAAPTG